VCVAFLTALAFTLVALVMALRELRIRPTAATSTLDDHEPQHAHS